MELKGGNMSKVEELIDIADDKVYLGLDPEVKEMLRNKIVADKIEELSTRELAKMANELTKDYCSISEIINEWLDITVVGLCKDEVYVHEINYITTTGFYDETDEIGREYLIYIDKFSECYYVKVVAYNEATERYVCEIIEPIKEKSSYFVEMWNEDTKETIAQSKMFGSAEEAEDWYKDSFVLNNACAVAIMREVQKSDNKEDIDIERVKLLHSIKGGE